MSDRSLAHRWAILRTLVTVPLLALSGVGCGGLIESGHMLQLNELHRNGDCATLLVEADDGYSFIEDRPDLIAQSSYLKADCYLRMGREDEAIALFRYVAEQHPTSPYAYQAGARADRLEGELCPERPPDRSDSE